MKLRRLFVALAGIAALAAACEPPVSKNPLSDPAKAARDERFTGVWHATLDGDDAFLHLVPHQKGPMLDLLLVGHDKDAAVSLQYEGFATVLDGVPYLSLREKRQKTTYGSDFTVSPDWIFARATFAADGALTLAYMDDAVVKPAIESKKLAGSIPKKSAPVRITADAKAIAALIVQNDPNLFHEIGTFRRVATP